MALGSIQVRLTAWFLLVLAVGLGLFGIGSWFAMRASAYQTVDEELEDRIRGVEQFMKLQIAALSPAEIRDEFREHSVLGPGGDLFQVCDGEGHWLYRSAVLEASAIPILRPAQLGARTLYETRAVQDTPVRFATGRVIVNGQPYTIQVAAPLREFEEALHRFRFMLLFFAPLLLITAALGGYWLSRRALKPVDDITRAAESISIRHLSERLHVAKTSDELQRLSETLNRMLARLEDSVKRMSQFTADASHELRAPLSVILTTAELAVQNGRTPAEYHDDMVQMLAEAERMTGLIESLLLLARSDAGQRGLELELIDISRSVEEAVEQARSFAMTKQIDLATEMTASPVIIRGNSDALRRLFFILIDNAIKYTGEGGRIHVELDTAAGQARIAVSDTGIGIAESDQPRIFDRFWRADKVRSRSLGGVGLGLSIAQWIIEQHGGSIEVKSAPGQGSRFTVRMPLVDANIESLVNTNTNGMRP